MGKDVSLDRHEYCWQNHNKQGTGNSVYILCHILHNFWSVAELQSYKLCPKDDNQSIECCTITELRLTISIIFYLVNINSCYLSFTNSLRSLMKPFVSWSLCDISIFMSTLFRTIYKTHVVNHISVLSQTFSSWVSYPTQDVHNVKVSRPVWIKKNDLTWCRDYHDNDNRRPFNRYSGNSYTGKTYLYPNDLWCR